MARSKAGPEVAPKTTPAKAKVYKGSPQASRKGMGPHTRLSKAIGDDLRKIWKEIAKLSKKESKEQYDEATKKVIEDHKITGKKELLAVKKFLHTCRYSPKKAAEKAAEKAEKKAKVAAAETAKVIETEEVTATHEQTIDMDVDVEEPKGANF